jgi:hypothetical protein
VVVGAGKIANAVFASPSTAPESPTSLDASFVASDGASDAAAESELPESATSEEASCKLGTPVLLDCVDELHAAKAIEKANATRIRVFILVSS